MPSRILAEAKARLGYIPMRTFTQNDPLTDAELDRLEPFLKSVKGDRAMNIEELDGFFAALIAGPETVMPSEYYSEVFGGEMSEACEFGSLGEANEILGLMRTDLVAERERHGAGQRLGARLHAGHGHEARRLG